MLGTASCNDDQVFNQTDNTPLQVSVNTQGTQSSRAIIHGDYLPDQSSIGISLFTPEGADYDNQGYFNVKYTASGEGESQTWTAQGTTPSISANEALLAAYYPYNPDVEAVEDLIAFPVENASQTDYMYSGLVEGITNANPKVNITMQHALTAIRVNLVLGNYTGDAAVSGIAVKSPALASAATLNIASGALDNISGQGDEFALTTEFDLITAGTATDVLFVPDASVTEGATTVSATIGGKKYTAAINFDEAYLQGYIYTYTLTLNNSGFEVTKVNVTPWKTGNDDNATLEPEIDNAYIVKIVASYQEVEEASFIEGDDVSYNYNTLNIQSRSGETFKFVHNIVGFVGTIDWGDGTTDTYTELTDNPSHYYSNDGQEYTITAKGKIERLQTNNNAFKQCLKEIVHIGDCGITSMEDAFRGCSRLIAIPEGLFDNCTEVTDFNWTFQGAGITSIPEGLFDKCTKVTSFEGTFSNTNITSISEGLFDACTKVTNFTSTFNGCTSLTAIPDRIFDKCTEVIYFIETFASCPGLAEIPEDLFKYNTKVKDFGGLFRDYTGEANKTFVIPEGLFRYNTEVENFCETFYSYNRNIDEIPVGLFDNNRKVNNFRNTFIYCNIKSGESPYTLIDGVKVHLYERSNYPEYFTKPTDYGCCYYDCIGLTDYSSIPSDWK